jgi:hypothetical protein
VFVGIEFVEGIGGLPGACCSSALKYQISIPAIEFTRAIRAEASATSLR